MDIRKLQRVIVDGLEDLKAQHIVVFNTEHLSALFERVIIASGSSNRQTKSLASSVRDAVKKAGYPGPRTEGETNGEWIIVDCGAAVVHVMQPTIRDYYNLEEIWGDKPVNMKLASSATRLVKAAEPPPAAPKKAAAKKAAAKKAAPKSSAAKRAPAAKTSDRKAPATRAGVKMMPPAARQAASKKTFAAPPGRVVTRVVGVKKASAAKKSPAAKRAPAKAPAARKSAAPRKPAGRA